MFENLLPKQRLKSCTKDNDMKQFTMFLLKIKGLFNRLSIMQGRKSYIRVISIAISGLIRTLLLSLASSFYKAQINSPRSSVGYLIILSV